VVRNYLIQQHGIPAFCLIPLYAGNAYPAASNDTEAGRKQNRRVVIQRIEMPKSAALYRKAIEYIAESKTDSALMMLRGWVMHEKDGEKILALFDPRLESIRKDARWKPIDTRIKAAYARYPKSTWLLPWILCIAKTSNTAPWRLIFRILAVISKFWTLLIFGFPKFPMQPVRKKTISSAGNFSGFWSIPACLLNLTLGFAPQKPPPSS